VRQLCLDQGLPAALIDGFTFGNSQVQGFTSGNPDLMEESADTVTFGLVYRPQSDNRFLSNLQLSADFYRIKIEDAIQAVAANTFVRNCYDPAKNPNFDPNNFFCNFFNRDPSSGIIVDALQTQSNIGAIDTSGVDVQVDWAADVGAGRLSVNLLGSWLKKYDRQDLPGDEFRSLVDTIGNQVGSAFPRWKGTLGATYSMPFGLSVNTRLRYIDNARSETVRTFEIPSVTYTDLTVSYKFPESFMENLSLRLGVLNLTDKEPMIYPGTVQNNTDPSTYDVLGRRFFLRANLGFK
jgi:iron complex outermembrane recepter protein